MTYNRSGRRREFPPLLALLLLAMGPATRERLRAAMDRQGRLEVGEC